MAAGRRADAKEKVSLVERGDGSVPHVVNRPNPSGGRVPPGPAGGFQRENRGRGPVDYSQHQNAESYRPVACEQHVGKLLLKRIF
jgi:hypothetical protein